ncbi:MAG: flotillin-like protein FloA [Pirellulales bacterium]
MANAALLWAVEVNLKILLQWGFGALAVVFAVVMVFVLGKYGGNWFQAYMSSADVRLSELVCMGLRQVPTNLIVNAKIMAAQAGLGISRRDGISTRRLEAHYLAGGRVLDVIQAIIAAHRAGLDLDFDRAAAIDLAGRDVVEAVRTSVHPKVIDCPDPRSGVATLSAIARNGVELRVRARVTVRTNLEQLIGGATEDTIIARVGEGIITSIGSSDTHLEVLENPDRISKAVLSRGLDAQTAFKIVSIDIADIDVGEQIGARLQADQAEADTRVARAKAEQRRAEAIAVEQEMKAKVSENRSRLVLAEAEVPRAMADAFRSGHLHATEVQEG